MDAGERVICISASGTRTYYAINETDGITYTTDGIVYLINHDIKHPKWILSYEEIAKRLDIPFTQVSTMNISRTKVLNDGLWRFAVQFGEQVEGIEYLIDVNPDTGSIEWVQSNASALIAINRINFKAENIKGNLAEWRVQLSLGEVLNVDNYIIK